MKEGYTPYAKGKPMKTTSFHGQLFNRVTRVYQSPDPANPNRMLKEKAEVKVIKGLIVDRISGHGLDKGTNQPYVTLSGQYGPFATARITASTLDKVEAVKAVLEPLLPPKESPLRKEKTIQLKDDMEFDVVVTPMKGFGFVIRELYHVTKDEQTGAAIRRPVISAPIAEGDSGPETTESAFV